MRSRRLHLILASFLMLFVELVLIRWAGSNVVYLSYFSNFVLLGSFLGIGIGFLRANARPNLFPWAIVGLAALVAFVELFPARIDFSIGELLYYQSPGATGLPIWLMLPLIFIAVAAVMEMIAEGVARVFKEFEPLEAYRLDILGSLLGIGAFSVLSFTDVGPLAWGVVAAAAYVFLVLPRLTLAQVAGVLVLVGVLGYQTFGSGDQWSPYYRISTILRDDGKEHLYVNGSPHQVLLSNTERREQDPHYWIPYEFRTDPNPPRDVLVIGAGAGADTATAVQQGAAHVDAVEIDPKLTEIGFRRQPDRVFQDPSVESYVTDGRAFLERTQKTYDLILFALPDSLTLLSGSGGVRLESYLFTRDAVEEAKAHLRPGGVLALYNFFREEFVADRIGETLRQVFGHAPCYWDTGVSGRQAMFVVSEDPSALSCPDQAWAPPDTPPAPVSDDRPFVYLEKPGIPDFYLLTIVMILMVSLLTVRAVTGPLRPMVRYADLFFMGAAFLLLETKNVVQFALLFGTTWFVNALVFAGILLTVLGAIEVARRFELRRPGRLYAVLFPSLAVAWAIPPQWLLNLSMVPRFVVSVVVAFAPVFLANLVFSRRFRDVGASTVAFGANLLGAMVGGLLEYSSLLVGYRALTVLAGILYALAWMFGRKYLGAERLTTEEPAEPQPEPAPASG